MEGGGGLGPPAHPFGYVWSNPKATTYVYVKRAVRKAHFKMNRAFKVILIGAGRNPEWSFLVIFN